MVTAEGYFSAIPAVGQGVLTTVAGTLAELAECILWLAAHERWPRLETLCREVGHRMARAGPQVAETMTAYHLLERAAAVRLLHWVRYCSQTSGSKYEAWRLFGLRAEERALRKK